MTPASRINLTCLAIGASLVCTSTCILMYVYAFASMVDPARPDYWAEVLKRMFRVYDPGAVTYPAAAFLILGTVVFVSSLFVRGKVDEQSQDSIRG